ncbi:MAG: TPM domain-containing protein [Kiritimatiellia bacterium]
MAGNRFGQIRRIIRHLLIPHAAVRRAFPKDALKTIAEAIRESETKHRGEIRFAVEAALDLGRLLRGQSAVDRARELFALLGVWDTAEDNGVLIYLLLADRNVEIVADRGIHSRVGTHGWETICQRMEENFRAGNFCGGVLEGVRAITEILVREYPATGTNPNELPDEVVVLR